MEKNNELRGSIPYDKDKLAALAVEFIATANKMGADVVYSFTHSSDPVASSGIACSPYDTIVLLGSILRQIPRPEAMAVLKCLKAVLNEEDTEEGTEDND